MRFKSDAQRKYVMSRLNARNPIHYNSALDSENKLNTGIISEERIKELKEFADEQASKAVDYPTQSETLQNIFGDSLPISEARTGYNLEDRTEYPLPLFDENTDYPKDSKAYLTPDGYFISAGNVDKDGYQVTHGTLLSMLTSQKGISDWDSEKINNLAGELNLVRIFDGGTEMTAQVFAPITTRQLKAINHLVQDAKDQSKEITLEIGESNKEGTFYTDNSQEFSKKLHELGYIT